MLYECEQCEMPLSQGLTICPRCNSHFDKPVPATASTALVAANNLDITARNSEVNESEVIGGSPSAGTGPSLTVNETVPVIMPISGDRTATPAKEVAAQPENKKLLWRIVAGGGALLVLLFFGFLLLVKSGHLRLGQPSGTPDVTYLNGWCLESFSPAEATLSIDNNSAKIVVNAVDTVDWHVQLYQSGLKVEDGKDYRLVFRAKADSPRNVQVYAGVGKGDYHHIGLDSSAYLTPEWQTFSFPFRSHTAGEQPVRLPALQMGKQTGTIWISDVVLEAGSGS